MNEFWLGFYHTCEWLMIITGVMFFLVVLYIVATVLGLKNSATRNAKRLYQPPLNAVTALAATGKGIAMQEKVRALHIAGQFKTMAGDVTSAASGIGTAAKTIHPEELKDAVSNAQSAIRFVAALLKMFRASSNEPE